MATKTAEKNHDALIGKIEQVAAMAGITGKRSGSFLAYGFDLGNGRDQLVFVAPFEEMKDGTNVICFVSPCQKIGTGMFGGLSRKRATMLLRFNAHLPFGHFAILPLGGEETLCVRTTQILETMEVQEFRAHCGFIAELADAWEAKLGQDNF